jgi:redox-sensitive bicupin YhaK (pirin superfamily)
VALESVAGDPAHAVVVMGEFAGVASPASAFTPIVGAEVRIPAGSRVRLPLHPEWEYAIVGVSGDLRVATDADTAETVGDMQLLYLGIHRDGVDVVSDTGTTLFLLGGEPFEDEIVMWWNFVGRSHEEIVAAREEWEAGSARFGHVVGHGAERVPAPPLPGVRLRRRARRL